MTDGFAFGYFLYSIFASCIAVVGWISYINSKKECSKGLWVYHLYPSRETKGKIKAARAKVDVEKASVWMESFPGIYISYTNDLVQLRLMGETINKIEIPIFLGGVVEVRPGEFLLFTNRWFPKWELPGWYRLLYQRRMIHRDTVVF